MNPFNYSIDDELLRYEEAANVKASNVPDTPNTADVVRYNSALGLEEVYTENPSGGHVKIAERSITDEASLKRYDTALRDAGVMPSLEDYYAFGADDDLIAKAGLSPQAPMGGRTEPLSGFEKLYVERQGGELLQAGTDQPLFEGAISEVMKGLARGGLVRPSQFLKENLNVYDPLVFQIVDPTTGEFDPQLKIVSREEKAEIDQKIAAGEMPYAVDFERLVEPDAASGMGAQMAGDLSQFVGAFAGVGKLFRLGGGIVGGATQGAAADFLAYRGDEGRLTDLLLEMGVPENKVTEFLKTDPNDPDYVGRFKTALEGGVIGAVLEPVLFGMGKTFRAVKDGDVAPEILRDAVSKGKNALGEAFLKQVQGAEERIAQEGTTLFSNPVGPGVDRVLAGLGKLVSKTKSEGVRSEGGLPIAQEKGDENLRLHLNRLSKMQETGAQYPGAPKNPRTVIPAPEGSDLPDIVVGNIEPDDWRQRIEATMSPEEINKAASWYKIVFGEFQKQANGDPEEIAKLTDAWFAGQQNSSPQQTLNDVLFVYEQIKRGVPKEKLKGKGLPSANKIVIDILTNSTIEGGAGQKISDFLDSGYGKNVRAIMGNSPEGGSPFVVDIHTARDTGLVDEIYINHLTRLGYDVPDNIIVDVGGGGIKGPQYESRALFGQQLTEELNDQNWMGRNDWEPAEIQAIGWMQLSGMYGGSNTGGDVVDAFTRTTRRISMEVDPGAGSPWAAKFGEDFGSLPLEDRRAINDEVTSKAIDLVNKQTGITLGNTVHGTGGWELWQNPSTVQQAIASKETAIEAGARLGYLLQQTEVWVNTPKAMTKNPKNFSIDIVETTGESLRDSDRLTELFDRIINEEPNGLFRGYQPIIVEGKPGIRILITDDAVKESPLTKAKAIEYIQEFANTKLGDITDELNFDAEIDIMEADLTRLRNNWEEDQTGGGYKSYFSGQSGKDAASDSAEQGVLDTDGAELESLFQQRINEAKNRSGAR